MPTAEQTPKEPVPTVDHAAQRSAIISAFERIDNDFARASRRIAETFAGQTPEQIDGQIVADKDLRRALDEQLQKVKAMSGSRERSLVITKLQEAIMWLGMDLKRLGESKPAVDPKPPRVLAEEAYHRYAQVTEFKNFKGDPMPTFAGLPERIQAAWEAVMSPPVAEPTAKNPYPNSYDPSNTKVDPTADNLKL